MAGASGQPDFVRVAMDVVRVHADQQVTRRRPCEPECESRFQAHGQQCDRDVRPQSADQTIERELQTGFERLGAGSQQRRFLLRGR